MKLFSFILFYTGSPKRSSYIANYMHLHGYCATNGNEM